MTDSAANEKGRVAVVTGSSRGIGLATAKRLALDGFTVVLNARADSEELQCAQREIEALSSVEVDRFVCDISDLASHENFVNAVFEKHGRVDCLVNNAGVSVLHRGDLMDVTPESYDFVHATNIRGAFFLTQLFARRMMDSPCDSGLRTIINISSSNAEAASIERGEYCISKSGVSMMTKLFALRLAGSGINVYEVMPGLIRTDMTAVMADVYEKRLGKGFSPINRWGQPEDVADTVTLLASGALPFTTGDCIKVDGGLLIPGY
jgi:NAD(P)-dependent dehydrogenase (short-subunit alcohol dehydrogenase family)